MYKSFYKLRKSPFSLNPDPDFLYLSAIHKNALVVLERSLFDWVGLSVITGEKGSGKSTLIQHLLKKPWSDVTFGLISEPDHPPRSLLQRTLLAFGLNSVGKTTFESYNLLKDFMVIDCFRKKRQPVLIIDEALSMESETLEELYMLATIEPEENRNLRIILVKPPNLWETLKRPEWRHLAQRVGNSFHLDPLDYQDTVAYVQHRLRVAGAQNENLFDVPAYNAIFRYSGGNPGLINIICNAALVQGFIEEKPQIGSALIKDLIKQKHVLRPATATPQGEAQGRSDVEGKKLDRTVEVQADTANLRPGFGRPAKSDRTGQTVSEFIIADIDQASRKYARFDVEVSKASDEHERTGTGEAHQGTANRLRRVISIAAIVLVAATVAILVGRDQSTRESQSIQRDQDAQGQGLIIASRPSEKTRKKIDQADQIQVDNESAPVTRNLVAQSESRDITSLLTGDKRVPEDATDPKEPSIPLSPETKQSKPDITENLLLTQRESKDNPALLTDDEEMPEDATDPKEPSIPLSPETKQSKPDITENLLLTQRESKDNPALLTGDEGMPEDAIDPKEPSNPLSPETKQPKPDITENLLLTQRESKDNTALLTGDEKMPEDATDPKEPSNALSPETKQPKPDITENLLLTQRESKDNTALLTGDEGVPEDATDPEEPSNALNPETKQSEPDSTQHERSVPLESRDNTTVLIAEDDMRENVRDPKKTSVAVNSDPKQTLPGGTESVEQRVAELLARAEQQTAAQHLVTPAGHAALETYQAILELVPEHRDALRGINRIKDKYVAWAEAARQRGQWAKAQSYAERAATVDPRDSEVAQLLVQIKEERKLMAEVAAMKKLEAENAEAAAKLQAEVAALRKIAAEELKKTAPQPVIPTQKPETVPSDLRAQRAGEVDNLLIKAQQQFEVQRLTQPAGDNAWETYQKVLQLDPGNQSARQGKLFIALQLESMARGKQQKGDLPASLAIVEEGLRVWPNHSGLLALKEEINRQIEGQRASKQVEEPPPPTVDTEAAPEPKTKKRRRVKSFGTFF